MLLCLFVSHFQDCSHHHDIFPHYDLLFVKCFNACQFCWLSSAPNCVTYFHSNLDDLTIVSTPKKISIPVSFLQLGFLGGIPVLFLFIVKVLLVTIFCCCLPLCTSGLCRRSLQHTSVASHLGGSVVWNLGSLLHWRTGHWSAQVLDLWPDHPNHGLALCRHNLVRAHQLLRPFSCCPPRPWLF